MKKAGLTADKIAEAGVGKGRGRVVASKMSLVILVSLYYTLVYFPPTWYQSVRSTEYGRRTGMSPPRL